MGYAIAVLVGLAVGFWLGTRFERGVSKVHAEYDKELSRR